MSELPLTRHRFGLKSIFFAITSIAVALSIYKWLPWIGPFFLVTVILFWIGMVFLFLSDWVDDRPVNQKNGFSQFLNLMGILAAGIGGAVSLGLLCFMVIGIISMTLIFLVSGQRN